MSERRLILQGLQLRLLPEHGVVQRGEGQGNRLDHGQDNVLRLQILILDQGLQLQENRLFQEILRVFQPRGQLQQILQVQQLREHLGFMILISIYIAALTELESSR